MNRKLILFILALCMFGTPALAFMSAGDYTDKMTREQRFGYMNGVLDMAIYQAAQQKNKAKGQCIQDWYYRDETTSGKVFEFLSSSKDLPAPALINISINRECGESK